MQTNINYSNFKFPVVQAIPALDTKVWVDKPVHEMVTIDSIGMPTGKMYRLIEKERERGLIEKIGRIALGVLLAAVSLTIAYRYSPSVRELFSTKETLRFALELPPFPLSSPLPTMPLPSKSPAPLLPPTP